MPIGIPAAMAISAGIGLGGQVMANRAASGAQRRQLESEDRAMQRQIALERERMAEERRRYDDEREAARPYQAMRMAAIGALAKRYGVDIPNFGELVSGTMATRPQVSGATATAGASMGGFRPTSHPAGWSQAAPNQYVRSDYFQPQNMAQLMDLVRQQQASRGAQFSGLPWDSGTFA